MPVGSNPPPPKRSNKQLLIIIAGVVLLSGAAAAGWWFTGGQSTKPTDQPTTSTSTPSSDSTSAQGLQLDPNKNYGDKYANGILPVGDNRYATNAAKKGYVYICNANFVPASQAGAQTRGPWFTNNNQSWDINKKIAVNGSVSRTSSITNTSNGTTRIITTNGFPSHTTGIFPVSSSDPAYQYDRNPSTITAQSLTYSLSGAPAYSNTPNCMSGEAGIMLSGNPIFNGFDAGGRDAGAWEVQDGCDGHPQNKGLYHYHTLSRCIKDTSVSTVIGFALDGFPITGPKVGDKNILTTDDLDECHGIISEINLDGKRVTTYHYVMTQDFPYSVSCFRSTASRAPGQPEGPPAR
jgi:hypothetical protein